MSIIRMAQKLVEATPTSFQALRPKPVGEIEVVLFPSNESRKGNRGAILG